jgi:hypothetical protein
VADHQLHVQRRTGLGDPSKDFRAAVLQRSQGNGMASRSSGESASPSGCATRARSVGRAGHCPAGCASAPRGWGWAASTAPGGKALAPGVTTSSGTPASRRAPSAPGPPSG